MKRVIVNEALYSYKVEPWLKLTDENLIILEKNKLITVVECFNKQLIQVYKVYLNSLDISYINALIKIINSAVSNGVAIGNDVIIAANSFVKEDVMDNSLVAGSPARFIRHQKAGDSYL
jgi:serine O-acetyltransferase